MAIYTDTPWFCAPYGNAPATLMLGLLKSLITYPIEQTDTVQQMLTQMTEILLPAAADTVEPLNISEHFNQLTEYHQQDFLVLAIIICLCQTEHHQDRLNILLTHWQPHFAASEHLRDALTAVLNAHYKKLTQPHLLGEGFHNKIARENGIDNLGWVEYKKQMHSMKQGSMHLSLKEKFAFLSSLPENTFGAKIYRLLKKNKLNLPGEKHGFAEFFLWHDLTHLLSGNSTNWIGELGANAYTAAFSKKGKFSILIWGLLQFNLNVSLAVVAAPSKNNFKTPQNMQQYLYSILSGSQTTLDLLNWPTDVMIEDLKLDMNIVRRKYNIRLYFDDQNE